MISNPHFLLKSIIFDYKLTSQLNLEGNNDMAAYYVNSKTVMDEAKEKLQTIIWQTQNLEVMTTKIKR